MKCLRQYVEVTCLCSQCERREYGDGSGSSALLNKAQEREQRDDCSSALRRPRPKTRARRCYFLREECRVASRNKRFPDVPASVWRSNMLRLPVFRSKSQEERPEMPVPPLKDAQDVTSMKDVPYLRSEMPKTKDESMALNTSLHCHFRRLEDYDMVSR